MRKILSVTACFAFIVMNAGNPTKNGMESSKDVFGTRVFVENNGQFVNPLDANEKVKFGFENGAERIYFTAKGLIYKQVKAVQMSNRAREHFEEQMEKGRQVAEKPAEIHYIQMQWANANPDIRVEKSEQQGHYISYGNAELKSNTFKKITYRNVYNNIDIEYIIPEDKDHGIKYNVILHPGANPSDIKIVYSGDVDGISLKKDGNIVIKTPLDDIIEHAPVSFSGSDPVASAFTLDHGTIGFSFPNGYDNSRQLTIDPWVTSITSLSTNNCGFDIDYDYSGNLYVYGGGGSSAPFKVAKYNSGGALQWTFNGTVASPVWNSYGDYPSYNYAGNFVVNRFIGKTYIGEGFNSTGTQIVRIDANGIYDNFITPKQSTWQECWDMGFHCTTGNVYGLGGSTTSNKSAGVINQTTGGVTPQTFVPSNLSAGQDIAGNCIDNTGAVYIIYGSSAGINNNIAKTNTAFTSTVWGQPSTYTTFNECANKGAYLGAPGIYSNGFNCLAVNGNYLFYWDGFNLAAYNPATGAKIASTTVAGTLMQTGGIDVDDCNNIYIGSNGNILSYKFTGSSFVSLPSIAVGGTSPSKYVYDIKMDRNANLLYVAGSGFVGTYSAINSTTCVVNQFTVTTNCVGNNNGSAVASLTTSIGGPLINYIWTNGTGTVSSTTGTSATSNSVTGLANGTYTVTIQINPPCGPLWTNTININCLIACSATATASTACTPAGTNFSLSVTSTSGFTSTPSYTWTGPGGYNSNLQSPTFTNGAFGVYTVTASNGGCSYSTTVSANVVSTFTPAITNTAAACFGGSSGIATTTVAGGFSPFTYTWTSTPVQNTPTASNLPAGTYTCYVTDSKNCVFQATTTVTQPPALTLTAVAGTPTACVNNSITLTASASGGTGPYTYTWTAGPNTNTNSVTHATGGAYTYTVTASDSKGCSITQTVSVTFVNSPTVTVASTTVCAGTSGTLTAAGATSYTWNPGGSMGTSFSAAPPVGSNVYTILGSTGGCTATTTATITVNALPTPTAQSNSPVCAGQPLNLNGLGGTTYTWTGPGAYISTTQNPVIAAAQSTNAGTYSLSVTDANGCKNNATTNVVVNPLPVIAVNNPTVCVNQTINLTSNGGSTYSWSGPGGFTSGVQNPSISNAALTMSGAYTVTVTSAAGCSNTAVANVTVITLPAPTIISNSPVCVGTTLSFTANGGATYSWSGPNGFNSVSATPNINNVTLPANGVYTLIASAGTCSASTTASVTVNALPTPTAQSNSPVCAGQAINLTGSGASTYTWTGPGGFSSTTQNPVIATAQSTNAGTYSLNVTDANGCKNNTSTNVVVNALPVIAVNNPTVCLNQTISLTSNGGASYSWNGPGSYSSNQQNPNIANATMAMSGQYTVTVTSAAGCSNTAVANVTVFPLPTPAIVSNSPCVGGSLNLQGSGGATYSWSGPGYSGAIQNPVINNITMAANGVYTLIASAGTCSASATATVVVHPLPVLNFANTNVSCFGLIDGSSTVNTSVGTGPYTYTWNTNPVQSAANVTGLGAGNYSCIVSDTYGCTSSATTTITQPPALTLSINAATLSACAGNNINVTGAASGGSGSYTYTWSPGPTTSNYAVNESVAGNYTYSLTSSDAHGCTVSSNIQLTFNPNPNVTATSATVCAGQTAILTANGASTYIWQPGNVVGSTYTTTTPGNITVIGTSQGCSGSASATMAVNPLPNISIVTPGTNGCAPVCIDLKSASTSSIVAYNWMVNGAAALNASSYCFTTTGSNTLSLSVVDINGCMNSATPVNFNVYPQPVADFNYAPLMPLEGVDEVTFTDASYGSQAASWNWYFMNTAQYTSTSQNPTFIYPDAGEYAIALVVKSTYGCMDTVVKSIVVGEDFGIYVPNAFTPNGDGLNDIFYAKGFGVKKFEMDIFDRWGEKVFSSTDINDAWDGTYQTRGVKLVQEGVYTWRIKLTNINGKAKEITGHVTLIK